MNKRRTYLAPSILAADLLSLGKSLERVRSAGADWLHIDIMDGHFVPNLSFSPALVRAVRSTCPGLWLDVHLMVDKPGRWIRPFHEAGADSLTVHIETIRSPEPLREIHSLGLKTGISLKPATPVAALEAFLPDADQVLIMTVEPGFGGQKLIEDCALKAEMLRKMGYQGRISCDGGVRMDNAAHLISLGADVLVMGTCFFRSEDPKGLTEKVHSL